MRRPKPGKLVIGLTGGMGAGKSTVAAMFKAAGAEVIDADRIAHGLLAAAGVKRDIERDFGKRVLSAGGELDRRALGRIVFGDIRSRKRLEMILHPRIIRAVKEKVKKSKRRLVVIDAPLLFETGLEKDVDKVVTVTASREKRIRRCRERTGLSRSEVLSRMAAQMAPGRKARSADFVIDNNRTPKETKGQVEAIRRNVWRS